MRSVAVIAAVLLWQSGSSSARLEHIDSDQSQRRPRGVVRLSGYGGASPSGAVTRHRGRLVRNGLW
jgi:hypothetical protein